MNWKNIEKEFNKEFADEECDYLADYRDGAMIRPIDATNWIKSKLREAMESVLAIKRKNSDCGCGVGDGQRCGCTVSDYNEALDDIKNNIDKFFEGEGK